MEKLGLVIKRRIAERILVGSDIVITVLHIGEDRDFVEIAVKAPKQLDIKRKESFLEEKTNDGIVIRNISGQRHKRD